MIVFRSMGQDFFIVFLKKLLETRWSQDEFEMALEEDLTTVPDQSASLGQHSLTT